MADLRQYQIRAQLALHQGRVARARAELRHAATLGRLVVATSWGKDSCALAHLAIATLAPARVTLMHLGSAYALPGGERVVEYFRERADVVEVEARRTLPETIAWLREVGLPHQRSKSEQGKVVKGLKKDPGAAWCLEHGYQVQALGMRAEEAKGRRACFRIRSPTYQLASGLWVTNPLAWWETADVWAFLVSEGVPWHPLYDAETHGLTRETIRNTGWLSTDGAYQGRIMWLRKHYPEQYRMLVLEFPEVATLA